MFKKLIIVSMILIIFTGCSNKNKDNDKDRSWQNIKDKKIFVVGLDDSFPPMGFKDEDQKIVGYDIDLAKEAAKRMNVNVEFKAVEWDGVILSLKNKEIDVIWNGLSMTEDRKKYIEFSKPYLENRQIIMVNEKSNIENLSDLKNKIIGMQMGSTAESALKSNENFEKSLKEVRKYSNNVEAFMDLKANRLEAVVVDEIVARYYMKKQKGFKIIKDDLGKESYGVGLRKEDKEFLNKLNSALDDMKKDKTIDKINAKWFSK